MDRAPGDSCRQSCRPTLAGTEVEGWEWPDRWPPQGGTEQCPWQGAHHSRCRKAIETSGTGAAGMAGAGGCPRNDHTSLWKQKFSPAPKRCWLLNVSWPDRAGVKVWAQTRQPGSYPGLPLSKELQSPHLYKVVIVLNRETSLEDKYMVSEHVLK